MPPGRRTRRTSLSALTTSGIVHSVNVLERGVDGRVVEREVRAVEADELDPYRRRLDAFLRQLAADQRRVDRVHVRHLGRAGAGR